jgi:hypothetical protein
MTLRELAEAATPGPWRVSFDTEYGDYGSILGQSLEGIRSETDGSRIAAFDDDYGHDSGADAAYIAAASPDVVLRLLAIEEAARVVKAEHDANGHREPCVICEALEAPHVE